MDTFYVASRPLSPEALAEAVRSHWAIESLHWVRNVTFGEDKAKSRTGHGSSNMATVCHFAFNILKTVNDKRSLKLRRNKAARNPDYMATVIGQSRSPGFSAVARYDKSLMHKSSTDTF